MDSSVTVQDEFTNTHGSLSALPLLPIGDRLTRPDGLTELRTPGSMRMSDWELQDATCCQSLCLSLRCSVYDKERAFIRLRDNSLEINDTNSGCNNCGSFCGKQVQDNISVYYFDRPPFAKHECAPFPFCCCGPCGPAMCSPFPCCCCAHRGRPKLEVASRGCVCCCTEFSDEWDLHPFCRPLKVVIVPFEQCPPPCCCCSNRINRCAPPCCGGNCCRLCGRLTGSPRMYTSFAAQPRNPEIFVAVVMQEMARGKVEEEAAAAVAAADKLTMEKRRLQIRLRHASRVLDDVGKSGAAVRTDISTDSADTAAAPDTTAAAPGCPEDDVKLKAKPAAPASDPAPAADQEEGEGGRPTAAAEHLIP